MGRKNGIAPQPLLWPQNNTIMTHFKPVVYCFIVLNKECCACIV